LSPADKKITRTIMEGRRRTPISPLQVGAIKEMVANKQFNGDMEPSISRN